VEHWTVFLETDADTPAPVCQAVEGHLPLDGFVSAPQGALCAFVTVPGAAGAGHAVTVAEALAVVRAEAIPADRVATWTPQIPPLATPASLAAQTGKSKNWVRQLLARKGAPDPVPVEGERATIYVKATALAYLRKAPADGR
jgi:hypothetical protein